MTTTTKLLPLIHLNGSGMNNLLPPAMTAMHALEAAYTALRAIAPHGRDYYPLGAEAFEAAAKEHVLLCAKLKEVQAQVEAHTLYLYNKQEDMLSARGGK